jgi:hypothetical protein
MRPSGVSTDVSSKILVEFGYASAKVFAAGTVVDFDISALPPPV